jgi:hypothetical protein
MPKLPKFTLERNEETRRWELQRDMTGDVVRTFKTKESATREGVLERAVGPDGGSVKIQKQDGEFQEERTYPGSRDPRSSKG